MTLRHGRNCGIYINGVDLSGDVNAVTVQSEQELADVTTFGQIGHTLYPGLAKDSGTIEALYNSTSAAVFNAMLQIHPSYPMMITFGQALGDPAYGVGEAMLNNHSIKSVVSDVNRVSFTFDVDNYPFEKSIMLTTGIQAVISNSTFQYLTAVNAGSASGTTGGAGYLQVMSVVGTPLAVIISHSSTGAYAGEQTNIIAFISASTSGGQRIATSSQIQPYTRIAYSVATGTGGACTFAVALTRY